MRRSVAIGSALIVACAVALALVGATRTTGTAFTTAVVPDLPTVTVPRDGLVCQSVEPVRARFDRIDLLLAPGKRDSRPPVDVEVQVAGSDRVVARGEVDGGWRAWPDGVATVRLDRAVQPPATVDVCLRNAGRRAFQVWGSPAGRYPGAQATLRDGSSAGTRLTLRLGMAERSRASELASVLDRLTLFRTGWMGPWLAWILVALVLLAVPALLVVALRSAGLSGPRRASPPRDRTTSASDPDPSR